MTEKEKTNAGEKPETVLQIIHAIVEAAADGDYIFRGEPKDDYEKVSSGLYRYLCGKFEGEIKVEKLHVQAIQAGIIESAKRHTSEKDDFEILAQLQHYGGVTNLINFTTDYLRALYFACDGFVRKGGRVVLLARNTTGVGIKSPCNAQNHVIGQGDVFVSSLNGFIEPTKIVSIPSELKRSMLEYLQKYHAISEKTIYNDLRGFIIKQSIHEDTFTEFYKGLAYQWKGDGATDIKKRKESYETAIGHYTRALEMTPQHSGSYINRGSVRYRMGKHGDAMKDYDKAIELDPNNVSAHNNRGVAKGVEGKHEEAIEDFNRAIEIDPNDMAGYNNRGIAMRNLGRHEDVIKDFDKVIEIDPEYANAYHCRGIAKENLGRYEEAVRDYDKAIGIDPQYTDAYINRGGAKGRLGMHEEAVKDYDEAIRLNPMDVGIYNNRGIANRHMGRYKEAIEDYDKAAKIDPTNISVYYNRGIANEMLGEHKEAIKDYNRVLEINPEFAAAYYNRGAVKQGLGMYKEAIEDFDKAIGFSRENPLGLYNRGITLLCLSQWDKARKDLIAAKDRGMNIGDAFHHFHKNKLTFEEKHNITIPSDIEDLLNS